jgi:hypothetical protein
MIQKADIREAYIQELLVFKFGVREHLGPGIQKTSTSFEIAHT